MGTLNNRCRITIRTQKGTIILKTTQRELEVQLPALLSCNQVFFGGDPDLSWFYLWESGSRAHGRSGSKQIMIIIIIIMTKNIIIIIISMNQEAQIFASIVLSVAESICTTIYPRSLFYSQRASTLSSAPR